MSALPASFVAMMAEAHRLDLPKTFRGDLLEHDYNLLVSLSPKEPFVWVLYEHGTHLLLIHRPVCHMDRVRRERNTAWALTRDLDGMFCGCRFYIWDGVALRSYKTGEECSHAAYLIGQPPVISEADGEIFSWP